MRGCRRPVGDCIGNRIFGILGAMTSPLRSIHVVAAVITDARGRILLNRRTGDSDMAGLWEFPGGKREPGETSEQALARELHEELGIEAEVGEWLMDVPQLYPDKRLRLEVRHVRQWKGSARGREGQAITWVMPDKLTRYSMPPADQPAVAALLQADRYLVTPEPGADAAAWLDGLQAAVEGGIRRVQVRAPRGEMAREAVECVGRHVELLFSRDIELARELGVGVHLGGEQLLQIERRPLPDSVPVAASCRDLAQLQAAQRLGCDFVVLGPVQATANHPGAVPLDWGGFERLREQVALPIYATGGIAASDLGQARRHGAQGVAASRALWPQRLTG